MQRLGVDEASGPCIHENIQAFATCAISMGTGTKEDL